MSGSVFTALAAAQDPSRCQETRLVAVEPRQACGIILLITQPECRHLWRHRVSCVVFCSCSLFFFLPASTLPAVSEMHRPSLTSAGLHPFSFTLHTIYALWEAKWCVQRHPLGVGQQQVSQNCIFLLLFFLSTADLEITRFKIRRQLSSPLCTRTDPSSCEIAATNEKGAGLRVPLVYCHLDYKIRTDFISLSGYSSAEILAKIF